MCQVFSSKSGISYNVIIICLHAYVHQSALTYMLNYKQQKLHVIIKDVTRKQHKVVSFKSMLNEENEFLIKYWEMRKGILSYLSGNFFFIFRFLNTVVLIIIRKMRYFIFIFPLILIVHWWTLFNSVYLILRSYIILKRIKTPPILVEHALITHRFLFFLCCWYEELAMKREKHPRKKTKIWTFFVVFVSPQEQPTNKLNCTEIEQ